MYSKEHNLEFYTTHVHKALQEGKMSAADRLNHIAKPLNSLGELENVLIRLGGMGCLKREYRRCVVAMCADNGVTEEGVTQTSSDITALVARSMAEDKSSVCCMAKRANAKVFPIDVGMFTEVEGVPVRKASRGTANIKNGPAMSRSQAEETVLEGIYAVGRLREEGYDMIAAGEMGIGNTTTSAAVAAVLLNAAPEQVTGRGAGLSDEGLARKTEVVREAISKNSPDAGDAVDVLSKVGGFDIAGMTGLFIGGAYYRVPIIIDGMISSVAALIAKRLAPSCTDYMIASHMSKEPAAVAVMAELGLTPLLNINMALGEGTGAVSIMPLIDMALAIYYDMPTFNELGMEEYKPL